MARRRSTLAELARLARAVEIAANDGRALQRGRVPQRVVNRAIGRTGGKIMRGLYR